MPDMTESSVEITQTPNAISIFLQVYVSIREERGVYYIGSNAFDVYSQGNTEDEAKSNFIEAIQLFIESCLDRGVLTDALTELGFQTEKERAVLMPDESEAQGLLMLNVPLPLLVADHVKQAQAH